jgi:ribose transport system permease protein
MSTTEGQVTEAAMPPRSDGDGRRRTFKPRPGMLAQFGIVPALAALIIVGVFVSPNFLNGANIRDVLVTASVVGVLAVGQGLVILAGGAGIDLSVGAVMTLAVVVAARVQDGGVAAVILGALGTGAFAGIVNGLGVTRARLEPFIMTLATLTMAQGAAYYVSGASPLYLDGSHSLPWLNERVLGIQGPILVFFFTVLIGQIVLSRTVFGRELYLIGGNEEAAHYAGIPVTRRRFAVYVISGLCAGLAGLLVITQLNTADPNFGGSYNLQAIAAAVVGGISLVGGRGSLLGVAGGVLLIAIVSNILGLLNVNTYVQLIATGLLVILAVGLNRRGRESGRSEILGALPLVIALAVAGLLIFGLLGGRAAF